MFELRSKHNKDPMTNAKPYRDYGAPDFSQGPSYQFIKEARKGPGNESNDKFDYVKEFKKLNIQGDSSDDFDDEECSDDIYVENPFEDLNSDDSEEMEIIMSQIHNQKGALYRK